MAKLDNYILVTGSRNLNDDASGSDEKAIEDDSASLLVLEGQGISILEDGNSPREDRSPKEHDNVGSSANLEPRDQISRELMDQGGIEIISSDEEESFL
ncbi:MAG: hypothetical protein AAB770_00975 [Patescibacteria group bacterium]